MKAAKRKRTTKDDNKAPDNQVTSASSAESKSKTYPVFKKPEYRANGFTHQVKVWKNLKNMSALEKSTYEPGTSTHASLSAPPSTKPVKSYSDLSGLPASYKDPGTKLKYANKEEYQEILYSSSDVILGYLALRKGIENS